MRRAVEQALAHTKRGFSGVNDAGRRGEPSNTDTGFKLMSRLALQPAEAG